MRTFGLLGDLAFFHDLSALVRGTHEDVIDATIVVVDNSGGGIFSFLPYSAEVEPAVFERGFATPQSPDPGAVAEALGCRVTRVSSPGELVAALGEAAPPGVRVVVARTERGANVAVHAALETAVAAAVDDAGARALVAETPRVARRVAGDDRVGLRGALDGGDELVEAGRRQRAGHLLGGHPGADA